MQFFRFKIATNIVATASIKIIFFALFLQNPIVKPKNPKSRHERHIDIVRLVFVNFMIFENFIEIFKDFFRVFLVFTRHFFVFFGEQITSKGKPRSNNEIIFSRDSFFIVRASDKFVIIRGLPVGGNKNFFLVNEGN